MRTHQAYQGETEPQTLSMDAPCFLFENVFPCQACAFPKGWKHMLREHKSAKLSGRFFLPEKLPHLALCQVYTLTPFKVS